MPKVTSTPQQRIGDELDRLWRAISGVNTSIAGLHAACADLKKDIDRLQKQRDDDAQRERQDVASLKTRLNTVENGVGYLRGKL